MSLAIWPPISPPELELKKAESLDRELSWITDETVQICRDLKHGLEDCYALLAPIDPGSTLVMSTPRNERVKGTITRVGTRIVKGSLSVQLRTIPAQTLTIDQSHPLHLHALDTLHTNLTQSINLLDVVLGGPQAADAASLASTLSLLAESLAESSAALKGPSISENDPPPSTSSFSPWQRASCPPIHFTPPLPSNLSVHIGLQDSCIVLTLRGLESVDAPVHLGTKLGLAFGTLRRLEHDEMDQVFKYDPTGSEAATSNKGTPRRTPEPTEQNGGGGGGGAGAAGIMTMEDVYVREKVRVDSADPSLISLYSKLGFLGHLLGQTRRNLAAVMGVDLDE